MCSGTINRCGTLITCKVFFSSLEINKSSVYYQARIIARCWLLLASLIVWLPQISMTLFDPLFMIPWSYTSFKNNIYKCIAYLICKKKELGAQTKIMKIKFLLNKSTLLPLERRFASSASLEYHIEHLDDIQTMELSKST